MHFIYICDPAQKLENFRKERIENPYYLTKKEREEMFGSFMRGTFFLMFAMGILYFISSQISDWLDFEITSLMVYCTIVLLLLLYGYYVKKSQTAYSRDRRIYQDQIEFFLEPHEKVLKYSFNFEPEQPKGRFQYEAVCPIDSIQGIFLDPVHKQLEIQGDFQITRSFKGRTQVNHIEWMKIQLNYEANMEILDKLSRHTGLSYKEMDHTTSLALMESYFVL